MRPRNSAQDANKRQNPPTPNTRNLAAIQSLAAKELGRVRSYANIKIGIVCRAALLRKIPGVTATKLEEPILTVGMAQARKVSIEASVSSGLTEEFSTATL